MIGWRPARDGERDQDSLARFCCWNSDPEYWRTLEVENHIRGFVLSNSENVVLFEDEGELLAVSAFGRTTIGIPLVDPRHQPCWHVDLVAVTLDRQSQGLSREVFAGTFERMRELDPQCFLITGLIHENNLASLNAAQKVGIMPFTPAGDGYWRVLGEVPPATL